MVQRKHLSMRYTIHIRCVCMYPQHKRTPPVSVVSCRVWKCLVLARLGVLNGAMRDSISTGILQHCVVYYRTMSGVVSVRCGWNWISGLEMCLFRFRMYANERIAKREQSTCVIDSVPINYDGGKCYTMERRRKKWNAATANDRKIRRRKLLSYLCVALM